MKLYLGCFGGYKPLMMDSGKCAFLPEASGQWNQQLHRCSSHTAPCPQSHLDPDNLCTKEISAVSVVNVALHQEEG